MNHYKTLGLLPIFIAATLSTLPICAIASGQSVRTGFDSNILASNDDSSSLLTSIGFTVNFLGTQRSSLYVNNNGNVTFDSAFSSFDPTHILNSNHQIIAPFWADVDTRGAGSVAYGSGTVEGHTAFGVNWNRVGYYDYGTDKLNTFQLVIVNRADTGSGNFDIELNYNQIQWDTGDASDNSATAGWSDGSVSRLPGTFYTFAGSGVAGAFLDSNPTGALIRNSLNSSQDGRYVFEIRNTSDPSSSLKAYWKGGADNSWSGANWASDAAGLNHLGSIDSSYDVIFSAAGAQNENTVLNSMQEIHSLAVTSTAPIMISGSGTLIISGNSGQLGISVDSGAGAATISSNLVLAGGCRTISVENTAGLFITGTLSGSVGVEKIGSGMLSLSGSNNYTGGTLISGGTVSINSDVSLGSIPEFTELNLLFSGQGGTLQIAPSSGTVTLDSHRVILIDSGATAVIDTNGAAQSLVISGTVGGGGALTKIGAGTLFVSGITSYTGGTVVQNGGLVVDGSLGGNVAVLGGVLGGHGFIGGNVLNQSIVSPGNSPGTLTIAGNYTQSSTGALLIQIGSPTAHDKLLVGGNVALGGTLQVSLLDGYRPAKGNSFEFITLTGAGAISGSFGSIQNDTLLRFTLQYGSTGVSLIASQGLFADVPGLTPNQLSVAKRLDSIADNPRMAALVNYLNGVPETAIPGKLEKIMPTDLIPMFDASIATAQTQAFNLQRRMEEIRGGAKGFSASGLNLSDSHGTRSYNGNSNGTDGKRLIDKDGKELSPAPISDRWGFFINGSGELVDQESTAIARGTDFTTGGITTGADYRLGDHAAVGLTTGYASTTGNGRTDGAVKIDSGKLGLYGTVFGRGFFLNGVVGGGLNNYDTKRDTIGGNARGDATGKDFSALLGTGYTYRKGGLSVGPIASLRYSWVGIDGFTEHGSLAPLRISDQSEASLKSTAGLQTSYAFQLGKTIVTPQVRAQWQHEYLDTARGIGASFLPGGAFTVHGPEIGRDSLLLDLGTSVQLTQSVGVYAFYTGNLGGKNYTSHAINGGLQLSF